MTTISNSEKIKREIKKILDVNHILWFFQRVFTELTIPLINVVTKKLPQNIAFASYPDFSGNAKGLWEYIDAKTQLNTVWLVNDKNLLKHMKEMKITAYHIKSFRGMMAMIRCKYLICTHHQFSKIKKRNQIIINLWHGMPIKTLHFIDNQIRSDKKRMRETYLMDRKIDYLVVTSDLMRYIFASCFQMDINKIVVKGQPRCEKMLVSNGKSILSSVLAENLYKYKKIILYAPTFRDGLSWRKESDGKKIDDNIFRLDDYDADMIDQYLKEKNILIVAKLHPYEEFYYRDKKLPTTENIRLLREKDLSQNLVSLYDVLNAFDILITDYSSIYLDYLLLDRPIIFIQSDLELYRQKRGFIFENYNFWMPGEKATQLRSLLYAIDETIEKDRFKDQRKLVNDLINERRENVCKDIVESMIL